MKSNKQRKKELYAELKLYFEDAHEEEIYELESQKLINISFDCEKARKLKTTPAYERNLKQIDDYEISDIEEAIKISSGKYYHIFDYYNQISDRIYQGYDTSEYSQYRSDLAKMQIPYLHCNSEDKSFKDVGVFNNLQELKEHLINELNEYAGCDWNEKTKKWLGKEGSETKANDIQVITKKDKDDEIQEMAFISTKWHNQHFWLIRDKDAIQMLNETIDRGGQFPNLKINEEIPIPNDWKNYKKLEFMTKQGKEIIKEFLPQNKTRGRR